MDHRAHLICLLYVFAGFLAAEEAAPVAAPGTAAEAITAPVPEPARAAYLGIAIDGAATTFEGHGLVVLRVEPGSPAAVMGIAGGDRLLRLDGTALRSAEELQRLLAGRQPGGRITIEALRAQGADGRPEPFTCTGLLQELPRSRTGNLGNQLTQLQSRLAELEDKAQEPTLAEILKRLQSIEKDLPKAAAAFKRIYPEGEFRIAISVEVTSHKTALVPLAIEVGGRPAEPASSSDP